MKLKVDYIDKEKDIKKSCLIKDEEIRNREDKERIKRKIMKSLGLKDIEIVNWKVYGRKRWIMPM